MRNTPLEMLVHYLLQTLPMLIGLDRIYTYILGSKYLCAYKYPVKIERQYIWSQDLDFRFFITLIVLFSNGIKLLLCTINISWSRITPIFSEDFFSGRYNFTWNKCCLQITRYIGVARLPQGISSMKYNIIVYRFWHWNMM